MARYIGARRALAAQVHAQTPMRFLHRLDLLPHLPAPSPPPLWEWSGPGTYDEPSAPDGDPVEEWAGEEPHAPGTPSEEGRAELSPRVIDRPLAGLGAVERDTRPQTPVADRHRPEPPSAADRAVRRTPVRPPIVVTPAATPVVPGRDRQPSSEPAPAVLGFAPSSAAPRPESVPEALTLPEPPAAVLAQPGIVTPPAPEPAMPLDAVAFEPNAAAASGAPEAIRDVPSEAVRLAEAVETVRPEPPVTPPAHDRVRPPVAARVAPPARDRVVPPVREPKMRPATPARGVPLPVPVVARTPDLSPPPVVGADERRGDAGRPLAPPVEGRAKSVSTLFESPTEERTQIARDAVVPGVQPPAPDDDVPVSPEAREVEALRATTAGATTVEPTREVTVPRRARIQEMPAESRKPKAEAAARIEGERPGAPRAGREEPGPAPAPPLATRRDSVFTLDDGVDRSPAAWAARLAQGGRTPAPKSEASVAAVPGKPRTGDARPPRLRRDGEPPASQQPRRSARDLPVPISPAARRFLTPLVGIDPAEATIVQGPGADERAAEHRADAVTAGDTIALSSSFESDSSPEGLGLIAHELTHVARRATPRFVPPVARRGDASESVIDSDEEALALRVEGRVRALAPRGPSSEPPGTDESDSAPGIDIVADPRTTFRSPVRREAARDAREWGGLPAPWEPLPGLPQTRPDARAVESTRPIASTARTAPTAAAVFAAPVQTAAARPSAQAPSPTVRAADIGRTPDAGNEPGGGVPAKAGPPDLDRLARQVYSVLKRRLQADARRERV